MSQSVYNLLHDMRLGFLLTALILGVFTGVIRRPR